MDPQTPDSHPAVGVPDELALDAGPDGPWLHPALLQAEEETGAQTICDGGGQEARRVGPGALPQGLGLVEQEGWNAFLIEVDGEAVSPFAGQGEGEITVVVVRHRDLSSFGGKAGVRVYLESRATERSTLSGEA